MTVVRFIGGPLDGQTRELESAPITYYAVERIGPLRGFHAESDKLPPIGEEYKRHVYYRAHHPHTKESAYVAADALSWQIG